MELTCKNCGASLNLVDRTRAVCPYCGQTYMIDEAKGVLVDLSISYDESAGTRRNMRNVKWILLAFLVVGGFLASVIFAYNIAAKNSKFSASDLFSVAEEEGQILKVFCKDIFGKEYRQITKEEFAQIKYIRYDSVREGDESLMAIYYSFTDYEDCASEEEFFETVQVWTHGSDGMMWPSNFTMFTGLTRIDTRNTIWLSQLRFSKKAHISCVQTDDSIETISSVLNPEDIKVLQTKRAELDGIEEYTNLETLIVDTNMGNDAVDLSEIRACTKLKTLYLHCGEAYVGCDSLADLEELESLYIDHISLSQCGFLHELTQLKYLTIATGENPDLTILTNLTHLRKLVFVDNEYIAPEELAKLECLTELEELEVDVDNKEALNVLQGLSGLKRLSVDAYIHERVGFDNTRIDLSAFSRLKNLEKLVFDNGDNTDFIGVEQLLKQLQFKSLQIGSNLGRNHKLLIDTNALDDNLSVTEIKLARCVPIDAVTEENTDFGFLTHYSNMTTLYLDECEVANIDFISNLTNLRLCSLRENEIMNFAALQACKKLEAVDVYGNPCTDVDLSSEIVMNSAYEDLW